MDAIMDIARRHDLRVIEDVAQAMGGAFQGRKLGTIGDAAALSFFPSKNLGGFGDGGMVVTDDDGVAELARMLRAHGSKEKYANEMLGYNSRLDELQAAMLRVKLPHLDVLNAGRRLVAARYDELLADLPNLSIPFVMPGAHHVYHQYTVCIGGGHRAEVATSLAKAGVRTRVYYPTTSPQAYISAHISASGVCPAAERSTRTVLSLPLTSMEDASAVARSISDMRNRGQVS
jgi:dTDP-4-amino-4,6-dideoxygalactose transaminase